MQIVPDGRHIQPFDFCLRSQNSNVDGLVQDYGISIVKTLEPP